MADQSENQRWFFDRLLRRGAQPRSWLAASDRRAIAALAAFALFCMATSWLASGGLSGELVDIDAAEPLRATFQTDINSAEWTELMQLPQIGEALSKRIVEFREQQGQFRSLDDLDRVPGIGPKTLESIRPYLRPLK